MAELCGGQLFFRFSLKLDIGSIAHTEKWTVTANRFYVRVLRVTAAQAHERIFSNGRITP